MLVYVMFSFWIQICRKLYLTNLANPKNPNLNLDSMDYGCEIRLLCGNKVSYILGPGIKQEKKECCPQPFGPRSSIFSGIGYFLIV